MLHDHDDLTLPQSDRQELIIWPMRCAKRLLSVFEAERPRTHACVRRWPARSRSPAISLVCAKSASSQSVAVPQRATRTDLPLLPQEHLAMPSHSHMAGHGRQVPKYTAKALAADPKTRDNELAGPAGASSGKDD